MHKCVGNIYLHCIEFICVPSLKSIYDALHTTLLCITKFAPPQNKHNNRKTKNTHLKLKMYFLWKMVVFHCHVGLLEGMHHKLSVNPFSNPQLDHRVHVIDLSSFSSPVALRTSYLDGFQWSFNGMILKLDCNLGSIYVIISIISNL